MLSPPFPPPEKLKLNIKYHLLLSIWTYVAHNFVTNNRTSSITYNHSYGATYIKIYFNIANLGV